MHALISTWLATGTTGDIRSMNGADLPGMLPDMLPRLWAFALRISGDRHDAETRKIAFVRPKPRPKIPDSKPRPNARPATADSNTVANTYRPKAPMDVAPCRPNAFDRFLKALNLRSGCEA